MSLVILTKIWERYILREMVKIFFLFLGCFFFLYALVDYSLHMQDFIVDRKIQLSHLTVYYFFQFVKRADLLVPLALLVATLKVLFSMNTRGELTALQSSGLPAKKILRPLFFLGLLCVLFNLISSEFLLPNSLNFLDQFREKHFKHSHRGNRKEPIHVLPLKDKSKVVYQAEDKENNLFVDVFWIRSVDEIWRMHSLSTDPKNPVGYFVDRLQRNREGIFEKTESFDHYRFSSFTWQPDPIGRGSIPVENRRLSELLRLLIQKDKITPYEYSQTLTHFLFKICIPFLPLLVILASAPFCLKVSRNLPIFFTYAIALFSLIAFFAFVDAAIILGENRILSPYMAIVTPFCFCLFLFGLNYYRST